MAGGCYGGVDGTGGAFAFNRLLIHFGSVSGGLEPEEIQREQ